MKNNWNIYINLEFPFHNSSIIKIKREGNHYQLDLSIHKENWNESLVMVSNLKEIDRVLILIEELSVANKNILKARSHKSTSVSCKMTIHSESFYFETIVKEDSPENEFIELVFKMVSRFFVQDRSLTYLESIEGYFFKKFPVRQYEKEHHIIKFYSGLTIKDKEKLEEEIIFAKDKYILLIDMSNFEGMGTKLCSCFESLIRRDMPTAWIINPGIVYLIDKMEIPRELVFTSKSEALKYLSSKVEIK
jgi:hypothetical protein